jgi:antirestriction protein ArdC
LLGRFVDAGSYYSTKLHELTHWSGNEIRLKRQFGKRFGGDAYVAEELVAEIGSAFLCGHLGIEGHLQHPEYVANWLTVLKGDKRAIFTAASKATQAADYLRGIPNGN